MANFSLQTSLLSKPNITPKLYINNIQQNVINQLTELSNLVNSKKKCFQSSHSIQTPQRKRWMSC